MKKAIFLCDRPESIARVYAPPQLARLARAADIDGRVYSLEDAPADTDVVFSTWGMPAVSADDIKSKLPQLQAVFYAAGSVRAFAKPFIDSGVRVFSSWRVDAESSAECTLFEMRLAANGAFRSKRMGAAHTVKRNDMHDKKIGLLGLGTVGSALARALADYDCEVWAFDSFASDALFNELGLRRADLCEIFSGCDIIANNLENIPEMRGIISREVLMSMGDSTTFLNTRSGEQINEFDLYDAMKAKPGAVVLLDALLEEERFIESPLRGLPNCITPHYSGLMSMETRAKADCMIDEFEKWLAGEKCAFEVTKDMLDTMA